MKLSLEWLNAYVDLSGLTPGEIAHKLTMATAEVEEVDRLERVTRGIVAARVAAVEPVDSGKDGRTINYVTVDTGARTVQTVCGAPNVAAGMVTAYASQGTTIAGGLEVREQTVYGKLSRGMLLSPREMGWGESHAGIMAFPDDMKPGTLLESLVTAEDHIIDIDNKTITHRPDLWGHYGFARELAAIYGRELKPLTLADSSAWEHLPAFPLSIVDTANCPGYCCLDIDGLTQAFSPVWMQSRLLAIGQRPINLLVDLTNYIMYELGQPMHAFDGERVRDIIVKSFGSKGSFRTLDSIDRAMIPDDLMICDHGGPVALAGVMGGEESEIKENTSRMLLESANFNPARIRRTSLRLNLRSDASMRFEKGQPPYHMIVSIQRFVQLLRDSGQKPEILSRLTCAGDTGETRRTITIPFDMLDKAIGMTIPHARITSILESLGFDCTERDGVLTLKAPRYRSARDISIPNDIVEEVARIYGYDNIVPAMPHIDMRPYDFNTRLQQQHKVRRFLSAAKGYYEVHTYTWYDDVWMNRIGYNPGEAFTLRNPAADNNTRVRRELLPNLLMLIGPNSIHQDRFSLYEVGNIHIPAAEGRIQHLHAAGVSCQPSKIGSLQDQFLAMRGMIEDLFAIVNGGEPVFSVVGTSGRPWESAGAYMSVTANGTVIGSIGYVTDATFPAIEKGMQATWFELNLDALDGAAYPSPKFEELPVYPGSWMDFSILADSDATFNGLEKTLKQFSHAILKEHRFLYRYHGKGLPEGKASYTFRFWLGLRERTLTGDDLTDFHQSFIAFLSGNGLSIR